MLFIIKVNHNKKIFYKDSIAFSSRYLFLVSHLIISIYKIDFIKGELRLVL